MTTMHAFAALLDVGNPLAQSRSASAGRAGVSGGAVALLGRGPRALAREGIPGGRLKRSQPALIDDVDARLTPASTKGLDNVKEVLSTCGEGVRFSRQGA